MEIKKYQELANRTINTELTDGEKIGHALHGMVSELGEIHALYQKVYQGHNLDDKHLQSELGDLMWFIAEYCIAMGWELDDICNSNITKLLNRYPDGFNSERSKNRDKNDI